MALNFRAARVSIKLAPVLGSFTPGPTEPTNRWPAQVHFQNEPGLRRAATCTTARRCWARAEPSERQNSGGLEKPQLIGALADPTSCLSQRDRAYSTESFRASIQAPKGTLESIKTFGMGKLGAILLSFCSGATLPPACCFPSPAMAPIAALPAAHCTPPSEGVLALSAAAFCSASFCSTDFVGGGGLSDQCRTVVPERTPKAIFFLTLSGFSNSGIVPSTLFVAKSPSHARACAIVRTGKARRGMIVPVAVKCEVPF